MSTRIYEDLIHDGNTSSVDGWEFSWFNQLDPTTGKPRATEERTSWGYAKAMNERMSRSNAALDLQTGGGEVLNTVEKFPKLMAATECWPPNAVLANKLLGPRGVVVVVVKKYDDPPLPFVDETFDLVVSRHPIQVHFQDIARILKPGGTYFAQHVGPRSAFEVSEFFLGPQPKAGQNRRPETAIAEAKAAGLEIVDLKSQGLKVEFFDVGAVVHFLRKIIWLVPDFDVEKYSEKLKEMHMYIQEHGSFVATSTRFLIEVRKPL